MNYGHFNRDGSEYLITTPDTPRFWHNYLHNDAYGVTLAQTGHGYSWFSSPIAYKVTRNFDMNYSATDPREGRFLYLYDRDSKEWWHANPQPGGAHDHFCCVVGQGWTRIEGEQNGIRVEATFFVPTEDKVELWRVQVTNKTKKPRRLRLFNYLEWFLGSYPGTWTDPMVYIMSRWIKNERMMWMANDNPDSLLQYAGFMTADPAPDGYDSDRHAFLGTFGGTHAPAAVVKGACANSLVAGKPFCGALQHDLALKPGASQQVDYLIGVAFKQDEAFDLKAKYLGGGAKGNAAGKALEKLKTYRRRIAESAYIETPDPAFDRYFNWWLKSQMLIVRNWTRFLYRGYRDVLQDLRGSMSFEPEWSKRLVLETLRFQYRDGTAPRQYNEQGGDHDLREYMDSPSWIPDTLLSYIKESGDLGVLNEKLPYFKKGTKQGHIADGEGSVYEHALAGVRCLYQNRGRHGLCLVGHGDWNDALNCVGHGGAGESVWLSCAFCYACLKMAELADHIKDAAVAAEMRAYHATMAKIINEQAWDGTWYIYAFDDDGKPIGSKQNEQGKTHLNVQTWAVFAGVATGARLKQVLKRIDQMDTKFGPVLLTPAYTKWDAHIGRITTMVPGFFENGSIYTHGASFKMRADLAAKRPDKAYQTFVKVTPLNPANSPKHSSMEPFGLTNFFIGPDAPDKKRNFGRCLYTYNSGSGNWLYVNALEEMLGVAADFDGLRIQPQPPKKWKSYTVRRTWRGAKYVIAFARKAGTKGVAVVCDGKKLSGNLVPAFGDGKTHQVDVTFG
ncbi:MAG: hypothetical protein L6R28_08755 [Planctomycetes bacterium]|nr:hypothetical protein [Planctomycetota bacterium]